MMAKPAGKIAVVRIEEFARGMGVGGEIRHRQQF
jgi:hypothetical protein